MVCIIGDRAGQLVENGEYWMGRLRVVGIINNLGLRGLCLNGRNHCYGKENVLNVRETASANSVLSFEALFGLQPFVNLKHKPKL
jgi:hypothetical protein